MNIPKEYQAPEGLRTLANYLRGQNGIKVRSGIEHEKRVEYFKGKRLVECILEAKKWPKSIPKITEREVAVVVAGLLVQNQFFHRSEKVEDKKGYLKISQKNIFEESGYYTWMYSGNMVWSNIATGLVIALVIAFTLMPIWPVSAKKILWYCSVTFLITVTGFSIIRYAVFILFWVVGYDFWIFPRLFDESLSFQDSFKPVISFEKAAAGQGYYRLAMLGCIAGFVYWALTQKTEFDEMVQVQKVFIDDLYSGKLLADVAYDPRTNPGDRTKKMPSLEDLIKEMEREAIAEAAAADQEGSDAAPAAEKEGEEGELRFRKFSKDGPVDEDEEVVEVEVDASTGGETPTGGSSGSGSDGGNKADREQEEEQAQREAEIERELERLSELAGSEVEEEEWSDE